MPRKPVCFLLLLAVLVSGCVGSDTSQNVKIDVVTPESNALAVEPYVPLEFEVSVEGTGEENVRWYVDDIFQEQGTLFSYAPATEGEHIVKVVADNGDVTAQQAWTILSQIDVAALMEEVSLLRGLDFTSDVPFEQMTRGELQGFLLEDLAEMEESIGISQKIFEALYSWSGRSLYEEMFSLYASNIEGLYDFEDKVFYTISDDDKPPIAKKLTMAHELVHVLQDQAYSITTMEESAVDDDQILAIQSLLEGDAMTIEAAYVPSLSLTELNALYAYYMGIEEDEMDPFVASMAYFPYIYGERFVSDIVERHGIEYLDEVYGNLPVSTEQVMHPEKYYASEMPLPVEYVHVPNNMEVLEENTLGEGMLLTIMSQHLPYDEAEEACAGWGGDHYAYYESEKTYAFVYDAIWDSESDAEEWYWSLFSYILDATGIAVPPIGNETWVTTEDRTLYFGISGDTTTLIISPDAELVQSILE